MSKQYSVYISPPQNALLRKGKPVFRTRKIGNLAGSNLSAQGSQLSQARVRLLWVGSRARVRPSSSTFSTSSSSTFGHSEQTATTTPCCRQRPMQAMITFISSPSSVAFSHCPRPFFSFLYLCQSLHLCLLPREKTGKVSQRTKLPKRHSPQMQQWHQSSYWLYSLIASARLFLIKTKPFCCLPNYQPAQQVLQEAKRLLTRTTFLRLDRQMKGRGETGKAWSKLTNAHHSCSWLEKIATSYYEKENPSQALFTQTEMLLVFVSKNPVTGLPASLPCAYIL